MAAVARGDGGALGGMMAGLPWQGREMGEVNLLDVNQRDNGNSTYYRNS